MCGEDCEEGKRTHTPIHCFLPHVKSSRHKMLKCFKTPFWSANAYRKREKRYNVSFEKVETRPTKVVGDSCRVKKGSREL